MPIKLTPGQSTTQQKYCVPYMPVRPKCAQNPQNGPCQTFRSSPRPLLDTAHRVESRWSSPVAKELQRIRTELGGWYHLPKAFLGGWIGFIEQGYSGGYTIGGKRRCSQGKGEVESEVDSVFGGLPTWLLLSRLRRLVPWGPGGWDKEATTQRGSRVLVELWCSPQGSVSCRSSFGPKSKASYPRPANGTQCIPVTTIIIRNQGF